MRFAVNLLLLPLSFCSVGSQSIFNSPGDYFGGKNDEPYLDWVETKGMDYDASLFLPSVANQTDGAAIHWKIQDGFIYLGVAVHATGWLGFGVAEAGGMKGSDLFYFETSVRDEVTDAHVLDVLYPVPDDCQDWELIDSRQDEGFLMVQTRRLLNTGDPQDRRIVDDSSSDIPGHRIIAAWGDTSSISYHVGRRARGMVRWYRFGHNDGVSFDKLISEQSDGYFELTAQDYPIKPIDTEYVSFCLTWSEVRAQLPPDLDSFMVIGVEELIDEDTAPYIHHFTAFGGGEEDVSECTERGSMLDLIYAWAPGENAMMTPENVGISFGGEDGHKSLRLVSQPEIWSLSNRPIHCLTHVSSYLQLSRAY